MIISDLTVKTKHGIYKNLCLDFSKNGLYIFRGPYLLGAQQTAKDIALKATPTFEDKTLSDAFAIDQRSVLTYSPAHPASTRETVRDYIKKGDPSVTDEVVASALKNFGLEINLSTPCVALSDEYKNSLPIIAAFLRETPYMIIDVPKGAGDATLTLLKKAIDESSSTVILITNEERFFSGAIAIYDFTENDIILHAKDTPEVQQNPYVSAPPPKEATNRQARVSAYSSLLRVTQSTMHYIAFGLFLIIMLIAVLTTWITNNFLVNLTDPSLIDCQIQVRYSDDVISQNNKDYAEQRNLMINNENNFSFDTVKNIASNFDCEVYIRDSYYIEYELWRGDVAVFSAPIGYGATLPSILSPPSIFQLECPNGVPKDWSNEAAISPSAAEHYNLGSDPIGKTLVYNGKTYTVTSTIYSPQRILRLSYNGSGLGVYQYDSETYAKFIESQIVTYPEESLIIAKNAADEFAILDHIITNAPRSYVLSNEFYYTAHSRLFKNATQNIALFGLIPATLLSLLLVSILESKSIKRGMMIASGYSFRYDRAVHGKTFYALTTLAPYIIVSAVLLAVPAPIKFYTLIPTLLTIAAVGIITTIHALLNK